MISETKFSMLSMDEKGGFLFSEGSYIAVRDYYNYKVQLYSLNGFYVEVWYNPVTNSIDKIESLKSEKTLKLYLSDIDIMKLMN